MKVFCVTENKHMMPTVKAYQCPKCGYLFEDFSTFDGCCGATLLTRGASVDTIGKALDWGLIVSTD